MVYSSLRRFHLGVVAGLDPNVADWCRGDIRCQADFIVLATHLPYMKRDGVSNGDETTNLLIRVGC